jgi:hypothetical protein
MLETEGHLRDIQMVIHTMAVSKMGKPMAKAFILGIMEKSTMENGTRA